MQHLLNTCSPKSKTPKKAAHAWFFCFTVVMARSKLGSAKRIWLQYRLSLVPGGAGIGLIFESDGDRHEENGFVGNDAGNGIGTRSRGGYVLEGCQGAAASCFRALGYRIRQRAYERLHLPRHHAVQPQAVGRRLFRPALPPEPGSAALHRGYRRDH